MKKKFKIEDVKFMVDFDGNTVETLILYVEERKKKNPYHVNWRFVVNYGYDYKDYLLVADRLETDAEFNKRKDKAAKTKIASDKRKKVLKAKKELEELELLEKLKVKYETGNYKKPK